MDHLQQARVYDFLTFAARTLQRTIRKLDPDSLSTTASCIALADWATYFNRQANACLAAHAGASDPGPLEPVDLNDPRM